MKESAQPFKSQKVTLQIAFGLLFVALGIYFIKHERAELTKVAGSLGQANQVWVLLGIGLVLLFVLVQGLMYQFSFKAIHQRIGLSTGVFLFLKRNFISVFLPVGMLTNMLFFNEEVEHKEGVTKTQIYFASTIFSVCSIASGIIVGLPALLWLFLKKSLSGQMFIGLVITSLALIFIVYAGYSVANKGWGYRFLERKAPQLIQVITALHEQTLDVIHVWKVIGLSCIIEIIGISHLYIAIKALGATPTLEIAIIGYAIVLLLLMSSPFLRGIGAIEVALTYALTLFGLSSVAAISITFLFRFFEFWMVLLLGLLAFVARKDNLLIRVLPSFLFFVLGFVNILSAITPAMPARVGILTQVLPLTAIHASTWLVLMMGLVMLGISVFLFRGLRNAWIAAVALSAVSLIAHLLKGIDWEEAIFAFTALGSLIFTRKQYYIKSNLHLAKRRAFPGLVAMVTVIVFGTIGFYFTNDMHFNADFTLGKSLKEAIFSFFLLNIDLQPVTAFGKQFLVGMHLLGAGSLTYVVVLLLRPYVTHTDKSETSEIDKAKSLIEKYGKSSLDYFKTYFDKEYWFSEDGGSFVAYKSSASYAVVLENPVCSNDADLVKIIPAFDAYCLQNGLRSAYYRIPEASKPIYEKLGKKFLPIGEEAVVNLESWTVEGGDKKGLRNAINKLTKQGYDFNVNQPPQTDAFLQQLRAVSDAWLLDMDRSEMVFSQGLFDEKELKSQTILTIENPEKKVVGFVNLIANFTPGEANFDLMRKTQDAPNGTMDFLFVKMFEHFKNKGFNACNIGMVPMSGINEPENLQERVIKLAYERIRSFGHYRSLRSFKEKFEPEWHMTYLAFNDPFDLIHLPGALEKVFKV